MEATEAEAADLIWGQCLQTVSPNPGDPGFLQSFVLPKTLFKVSSNFPTHFPTSTHQRHHHCYATDSAGLQHCPWR